MMKIELSNIGYLKGKHEFEFENGLSILQAPNGSGKSSLIKAIHLILGNKNIPQDQLNNYLTEKEINGFVKMTMDSREYQVQMQKTDDDVKITYSNIEDPNFNFPSSEVSFAHASSDLYQGIQIDDLNYITAWINKVTQVHKYKLFLETTTRILTEKKSKRDELKKSLTKDVSHHEDMS